MTEKIDIHSGSRRAPQHRLRLEWGQTQRRAGLWVGPSLAIASQAKKINRRLHVDLGRLPSFSSAQEA
ncbi:unnamed protein product [Boreogadus saida]